MSQSSLYDMSHAKCRPRTHSSYPDACIHGRTCKALYGPIGTDTCDAPPVNSIDFCKNSVNLVDLCKNANDVAALATNVYKHGLFVCLFTINLRLERSYLEKKRLSPMMRQDHHMVDCSGLVGGMPCCSLKNVVEKAAC